VLSTFDERLAAVDEALTEAACIVEQHRQTRDRHSRG
jgi:hypothetical protein